MKKIQLPLYCEEDIELKKEEILHQNAFIRKDGTFYLAKGYTGCNPHHQIESSALWIGRQDIGFDFEERFREAYQKAENHPKRLRYLRTILIHYYGYALFCRQQLIRTNQEKYADYSCVPWKEYYGQEATEEQIRVLTKLFALNDDETYALPYYCKTKEDELENVLHYKVHTNTWHT